MMHISVCCFHKTLVILRVFMKFLFLLRRKTTKLFHRRRNKKSLNHSVMQYLKPLVTK